MENFNFIIAKNLAALRKSKKLTQFELAEKLNYSDKAVSKWEQGESLPSIEILYKLSKIYGVTLDCIVSEAIDDNINDNPITKKIFDEKTNLKHNIITLLSVLVVWLVATIFFVSFSIFAGKNFWIFYCWSIPASTIVAIVFNCIWGKRKITLVLISILLWSVLLCFCLQFIKYNIWILLLAGIPLQIATSLCATLIKTEHVKNDK